MRRWILILASACTGGQTPVDDTDDTDDTEVVETDDTDDTEVVETDDTDDTDDTPSTDETDTSPCLAEPTVLTLGTGERFDEFSVLTAGQTMQMVNGAQGGWHLTLAVQVTNVDQLAVLRFRITDLVSGLVVSADDPLELGVALTPEAGVGSTWACEGRHTNIFGVLDFGKLDLDTDDDTDESEPWRRMCGHRARVDASVLTADDVLLDEASVEVLVQPDPSNGEPCTEVVATP